jgi:prepilin-type N-terminal cleavage/methylation domain-containing protein
MQANRVNKPSAFTLIELSIVLVIIGLIVGGILVGRDLINTAAARAQITQIEKLNTAVNTFRGKYGALPGDMNATTAQQFGFAVGTNCTGTLQGMRDGNGLIDGWGSPSTLSQGGGETGLFWQDLSTGLLIEGQYPNSGGPAINCTGTEFVLGTTPGANYLGDYFPAGKIGYGTYVYVYETNGSNWFGLSTVTSISATGTMLSSASIPVTQAYAIDSKMDDGLPTTGNVVAVYIKNGPSTTNNASSAASDSPTTCYNTSNAYSLSSAASYGTNGNCALSFKFQ